MANIIEMQEGKCFRNHARGECSAQREEISSHVTGFHKEDFAD